MTNTEQELIDLISKMLLPLISPYDISDSSRRYHYNNTPMFRRVTLNFFNMINNAPIAREKY